MKPQPLPQHLPWCDPLALARNFAGAPMVLLHSSVKTSYSGQLSLLATGLAESVEIAHFDEITPLLPRDGGRYADAWFAYFGYEMRHDCEHYTKAATQGYALAPARMLRFEALYVFDHDAQTLTLWSEHPAQYTPIVKLEEAPPSITTLASNMTRAEYEAKAERIIDDIRRGSLYQANLTRKFYGQWQDTADGLGLFARMCRISPAPYSAYMRLDDTEILSSSPELFLRVDADGMVQTRPIKGSAARRDEAAADEASRAGLEASDKNRAENLMITDLMRHDLSQSCVAGSIEVSGLFEVTTHATIHHMASTVRGRLAPDATLAGLLKASFPPGSMTGAPKIRAVELCNALEGVERGIYSGAIGWFGGDGTAEFSVVIRTLVLQGTRFEFQVGGGIVADSTPAGEWQETMDKALGILKTLDIPCERLEML